MGDIQNYTPIDDLIAKWEQEKRSLVSPVSGGKEGEPVSVKQEMPTQSEVKSDESEPSQETEGSVEEYIQDVDDKIELDPELKKAGLQAIDTSSLSSFQRIQLPLSDEKIVEGRTKPLTSSWRWLAEFAYFLLRQAHMSLKKIHGKVIRVLKQ